MAEIDEIIKKSRHTAEAMISRTSLFRMFTSDAYSRNSQQNDYETLTVRITLPDGRTGVSNSTPDKWEKCVSNAEKIAGLSEKDKDFRSIPEKQNYSNVFVPSQEQIYKTTNEELIERSKIIKQTAKKFKVRLMDSIVEKTVSETEFANSNGINLREKQGSVIFNVWVSKKISSSEQVFLLRKVPDFEEYTEKVCRTALVSAKKHFKVQTKKMPVLFSYQALFPLIEHVLMPAFDSHNKQKGTSYFSDKLGQQVADSRLSITDNGLLKNGLMSDSFDYEGTARKKTLLVEKGVLKGFLYDSYTANKDSTASTGNCSSIQIRPAIEPTNIVFSSGAKTTEDIIAGLKEGIVVNSYIGLGGSNTQSGDFSLRLSNALYIKDGAIKFPVKETMISGNIFHMLNSILEISRDAEQYSNLMSGPVLFDGLQVIC